MEICKNHKLPQWEVMALQEVNDYNLLYFKHSDD